MFALTPQSIESLDTAMSLPKPDTKVDNKPQAISQAAADPQMVNQYEETVTEWVETTSKVRLPMPGDARVAAQTGVSLSADHAFLCSCSTRPRPIFRLRMTSAHALNLLSGAAEQRSSTPFATTCAAPSARRSSWC